MNSFNPLIGINSSDQINDIDHITNSVNENYLYENFKFLTQLNNEYTEISKVFYKSLLESEGNTISVHEAYGEFFSDFKKIIDKFLAFIKNIFNKFTTKLNSFVQNEKYLLKNEKEFNKFMDTDTFEESGFKYSFDPNVPIVKLTIQFDSALMGDINKIKDSPAEYVDINGKTKDKTKVAIDRLHNDLRDKLENDYYDIFRGTVIGTTGVISEEDFEKECFKVYRSGKSSPEIITVSKTYINDAIKRIKEYKRAIKDIEKIKSDIDREYTAIRDKVEKMISPNRTQSDIDEKYNVIDLIGFDSSSSITDITITNDALTSLDSYLRTISSQIQQMSNIHSTAFVSKIEAVKEQFIQDKRFLYSALNVCQKGTRTGVKESYNEYEMDERNGSLWII